MWLLCKNIWKSHYFQQSVFENSCLNRSAVEYRLSVGPNIIIGPFGHILGLIENIWADDFARESDMLLRGVGWWSISKMSTMQQVVVCEPVDQTSAPLAAETS